MQYIAEDSELHEFQVNANKQGNSGCRTVENEDRNFACKVTETEGDDFGCSVVQKL
jgi:hypothetical protein